uniref:Fibronectin type-III domain-containing protein n=1 Tax=Timema bartmani TaxID=61472 RepID=A0A7R9HYC8_9NEOP|nr:unnamed protein product [Timema bartmani]
MSAIRCLAVRLAVLCLLQGMCGLATAQSAALCPAGLVSNLVATEISSAQFSLEWDPPVNSSCLDGYNVCYVVSGQEVCEITTRTSWTSNATLEPCTVVSAVVAAVDVNGTHSPDSSVTFRTAPEAVGNLQVSNQSSTSVLLTWDPSSSSCADHYSVSVCTVEYSWLSDCQDQPSLYNLSLDDSQLLLETLRPCEVNLITLATVGSGEVRAVDSVTLTLTATTEDLLPVQDLKVGYVDSDQFTLNWNPPEASACVTGYRVCFQSDPEDEVCSYSPYSMWLSPKDTLGQCTNYTVNVAATEGNITYSAGSTISFHTGPPGVSSLAFSDVTPRSARLTWDVPKGDTECADQIEVSWCAVEYDYIDMCKYTTVNLTLETTGYTITNLKPCMYNRVVVRTTGQDDGQSIRNTTLIRTGLDEFGSVRNLKVSLTGHVFFLFFDFPEDSTLCVDYFVGCYWETDGGEEDQTCARSPNRDYWVSWNYPVESCTNYTAQLYAVSFDNATSESAYVTFLSGEPSVVGDSSDRQGLASLMLGRYLGNSGCTRRSGFESKPGADSATSLSVTNNTATSVDLSWNVSSRNSHCVLYYKVQWYQMDDQSNAGADNVSTSLSGYTITGLDVCTQYNVFIISMTGTEATLGVGGTFPFYTGNNVSAVHDLTITRAGDNSLRFTYVVSEDNPCVVTYTACYSVAGSAEQTCSNHGGTGVKSVTLSGLEACTEYNITVGPRGDFHRQ